MFRSGRKSIKEAYRILYRTKEPLKDALDRIEREIDDTDEVKQLLAFARTSEKGIIR